MSAVGREPVAFLCQICRRQFPHEDSLDRHCCSSVGIEPPPQKLQGKRKIGNDVSPPGKKSRRGHLYTTVTVRTPDGEDAWTDREEAILEEGVKEFGTNWTLILYKFGSSLRLIHQQPCVLAAKWKAMCAKEGGGGKGVADVKPFVESRSEMGVVEESAIDEAEVKVDVGDEEVETVVDDENGNESVVPAASQPKLKLLVIGKNGRKNARNKIGGGGEDDEDYVPELGADSDSDCSGAADDEEGGSEEDEEEETIEEEEEEEEEEDEVELVEEGDERMMAIVENASNDGETVYAPTTIPPDAPTNIPLDAPTTIPTDAFSTPCASSSSSSPSSTSFVVASAGIIDHSSSPPPSIFTPAYLYLTDSGSLAFPLSSIQVTTTNHLLPSSPPSAPAAPSSTSSILLSEELPSATYATLRTPPGRSSAAPASASTNAQIETNSSSSSSNALPAEFQNLIHSEEFQRLLYVPVVELLAPGTRGHDLLVSVLSELARILAVMYPGVRNSAAASKFSDSVCVPWIRTFLPHFLSFSDMSVTFEGQDEPRPLLTGIQAKVKRLFLFYLNVLPPASAMRAITVPLMGRHQ